MKNAQISVPKKFLDLVVSLLELDIFKKFFRTLKTVPLNYCVIYFLFVYSNICILLNTEMGCGVDYMMGSHKWHGIAPNDEQLEKALNQLEETLGDY